MNLYRYSEYLLSWLETQRKDFYKMDGYVLGVSGGIDSAVVAHLLAKTGAPVKAYILPSSISAEKDQLDAQLVLESAGLRGEVISIAPMVEVVITQMQDSLHIDSQRANLLYGNLQARLRMVTLFTAAQNHRSIVVGTDNAAEWYTGYFTKFGDGAADVVPLLQLRKEQVFALAKIVGVPQAIIDKPPSAGLWDGQTDEKEMGVSYLDLDAHLRGDRVSEQALERITFWHERSHHKRILPLVPLSIEQLQKNED